MSVMRLLPPEIAFRYHALPVATDGRQVTVAIASPEDQHASEAIRAVIDAPVCFIQADGQEIDRRLSQLWQAKAGRPTVMLWTSGGEPDSFIGYGSAVTRLLKGDLVQADIPDNDLSPQELASQIKDKQPDLLVTSDCHSARMAKSLIRQAVQVLPGLAVLTVPPNPVWPIARILLVLPSAGAGTDQAVSWAGRLASANQIQVTVLPVLPPLPMCYGSYLKYNLEEILAGSDPLGLKLRAISRKFYDDEVTGVYKIREGDPVSQIREEIFASDPDLIVMPSCLGSSLKSWASADLGSILFKSISKPLLLTMG